MAHQPTLRVLKILELLSSSNESLPLSTIAKKLGIPASTLSPILQTLQEENYITCQNKNYALDSKILELGGGVKSQDSLIKLIKKHMKKIRDLSGQTCQMGILKGGNVLYLEKLDTKNQVQLKSFVGVSYPAYATSLGKALLEKKSKKELKEIYPEAFQEITPNTLKNIDELYKQIQKIKKEKIAIESGEMNPQIECMAIGIEHQGKIIVAISISYLIFDSNESFRQKNKDILLSEKEKIQKAIALNFSDESLLIH